MLRWLLLLFVVTRTKADFDLADMVGVDGGERRKCEPITLPLCQGVGYKLTAMPNDFNHLRQEDAGLEVHQFYPLVQVKCSPLLRFFLCSMYVPICLPNYPRPLKPCRSVCEQARAGCEPLMAKYGFVWPPQLACDTLPENPEEMTDASDSDGSAPEELCMAPPKAKTSKGTKTEDSDLDFNLDRQPPSYPMMPPYGAEPKPKADIYSPPSSHDTGCRCDCYAPFRKLTGLNSKEAGRYRVANETSCSYPCYSPYLINNRQRQQFLTTWIGIWSISCFVITLITFLTFLIDMERFQYPERPIFFLSFCYMMVSIGYIIRLIKGHQALACDGAVVHSHTLDPPLCTLVFLLIYFFGMASSVWWVIISFNWFLAAGLKWSHEGMSRYGQLFHALAWTLPSIQTLVVLISSAVDGDPLAGVCYVGNTDLTMLRWLVLAPLAMYGTFGVVFLLAGFVSLMKVRRWIKTQTGEKTEKLEHLMVKIGTFAFLYVIPAAFVVGALLYEQDYRARWERAITCPCGGGGVGGGPFRLAEEPVFVMALIKYSMSLVVGVTSGLWIWSRKTFLSWRRAALLLVCRRQLSPMVSSSRAAAGGYPVAAYQPATAIIVHSHTDVSSSNAVYSGCRPATVSGTNGIYPRMNHL